MSKQEAIRGIPLSPTKQIQVTLPNNLAVVLTKMAFSQLFGYAQATELEVSLLGVVDRDGCETVSHMKTMTLTLRTRDPKTNEIIASMKRVVIGVQ